MRLDDLMMAGKDRDDDETDLLTKTKPKTKRPPLYKVMLLNDDFTPMEFVVIVLERFFGPVSYTHLTLPTICSV